MEHLDLRRFLRDLPIGRKLTLITMLTSAVALLLAGGGFVLYERYSYRAALVADMLTTAQMVGDNSSAALLFGDTASAEQTLKSLGAQSQIVGAAVYDKDGKLFGSYHRSDSAAGLDFSPPTVAGSGQRFGDKAFEVFHSVKVAGEKEGTIYIRASLDEMRERLWRYGLTTLGVMLVAAIAAFILATRLQRVIARPIAHLATVVDAVSRDKNYALRVDRTGGDELGRLIDGFNEMLHQIQARDSALQQVRDQLEEDVALRTTDLQQAYARLEAELAEREAIQTSLRESEERFRLSFESSAIGMAVVSLDGHWLSVNSAMCRMLGYSEAELQLTDFQALTHPDDLGADAAATRMLLAGEIPSYQLAKRYFHRDGHIVWARLSVALARSTAGAALHFISQIEDITERKRAEQALADSETRLQALIGNSSDVIAIASTDGRILYTSPSVAKITGYLPADLVGRSFMSLLHPDDRADAAAQFEKLIGEPGASNRTERRFLRKDGSWMESDSISVNLAHVPAIGGIVSTLRDITERKQAARALRNSEERFSSAFEHASIGMALQGTDGHYLKVNRALCELLGYDEQELLRLTYQDLTHADSLAADALHVQELLSGKIVSHQTEKRYLHKQGHAVWAQISESLVRDTQGQPLYFITTVLDISQRKRAERELEQTHKQLLDVSRQAGMAEVATNVLHNVGNVLNSVNVSASLAVESLKNSRAASLVKVVALLREHRLDLGDYLSRDPKGQHIPAFLEQLSQDWLGQQESLVKELESLRGNIDHIKGIVAMQQSYAKVSGATEIVDLRELVEDSLRMDEGALIRHQVRVVREFEEVPPISLEKHKVLQILVNLVRNAKHACTERGGPDKCIRLRIMQAEGRIRISVSDNGVGIAPQNLTRIFAHGFTTRKDGHGFGLNSGALAATELGGSLSAQSDGPGQGATFTLELPMPPAASDLLGVRPLPALNGVAEGNL